MAVSKQHLSADAQRDNIRYIIEMLGQLHRLAEPHGHDMLCYLLEMAYLEANEIQMGYRS